RPRIMHHADCRCPESGRRHTSGHIRSATSLHWKSVGSSLLQRSSKVRWVEETDDQPGSNADERGRNLLTWMRCSNRLTVVSGRYAIERVLRLPPSSASIIRAMSMRASGYHKVSSILNRCLPPLLPI